MTSLRAPQQVPLGIAQYHDARFRSFERAVAMVMLFIIPTNISVRSGLTVGLAVCILMAPAWFSTAWGSRIYRVLTGIVVLCLVSGLVLAGSSGSNHTVVASQRTTEIATLLLLLTGIGVVRWASSILDTRTVALSFGLGLLSHYIAEPGHLGATNALKFAYLVPLSVVALALVDRRGLWPKILVILGIVVASEISSARNFLGTAVLVAGLLFWQYRPKSGPRRSRWVVMTGVIISGVLIGYQVATALLVGGYLGAASQIKSIAEINNSGTLILGGRPEIAASWALFTHHPSGYGLGVLPNRSDIGTAQTGLFNINASYKGDYVKVYLFGTKFELHSTLSDLWALYGFAGIALVAVILVIIFRTVGTGVGRGRIPVVMMFFAVWSIWNAFFSPFEAALQTLILSIGLAVATQQQPDHSTSPAGAKL